VKNQNFRDFEHIFIDGFSTDGTVELIKKYQQEFPEKVKFFQYSPKGIANAMNKGILHASGEYMNHLHSDDSFYDNNVLKDVNTFIENNNKPKWIYGKANFINLKNNKRKIIPLRKIYRKIHYWLLLITNYIPHQAVFINKNVFEQHGIFEEKMKNSMDYEYWVRLASKHIRASFINRIICNFSVRQGSQSETGRACSLAENLRVAKKYIRSDFFKKIVFLVTKINYRRKIF
jgi:glycosyltransferase involved in cell wall biosynthesis